MELLTLALGALVILLFATYWYLTNQRGHLEALGIPVVPPFLFLGSPPYDIHNYCWRDKYIEDFKKYGKTYGLYHGRTPTIRTIDPDVVKAITIKHFDSFTEILEFQLPEKHQTLDISGGETWEQLRKNLSPTFTTGKLKKMMEPMSEIADQTITYIEELREKSDIIDLKDVFQGLALNTIARCAFGIASDAHHNPDEPIIKYGKEAFSGIICKNWFESTMANLFDHFHFLIKFISFAPPSFDKLREMTKETMRYRKDQNIVLNDFINRLIELTDLKKREDPAVSKLSDDIIAVQGAVFFLAGFETTANNLSTFCYNMAKYPDIQEQVYNDIKSVSDDNDGIISHDNINQMEYLDAAINENLRMNGPATLHLRSCTKDCEIAPGFLIKKGTRIEMPIDASHHYPEFFPEPSVFRPERFTKENMDKIQSMTYRPFGSGPRQCIGQRFSLIEMKIILAKMILKYKIVDVPETKINLVKGDLFLFTYPDMKVKLELRQD